MFGDDRAARAAIDRMNRIHGMLRPLPWLPAVLYRPVDALTAALLPATLRDALGLRCGTAQRCFYRCIIIAVRSLRRILPERLTVVPQARRT